MDGVDRDPELVHVMAVTSMNGEFCAALTTADVLHLLTLGSEELYSSYEIYHPQHHQEIPKYFRRRKTAVALTEVPGGAAAAFRFYSGEAVSLVNTHGSQV